MAFVVEPRMILQNVTDNLEHRSKVVVLNTGKLLEIRQGNFTNKKGSPSVPNVWKSVDEWVAKLIEWKFPHEFVRVDSVKQAPRTKRSSETDESLPEVGTVLTNDDHTSKVVVLKSGELLEIRRGELTFTKNTLKTTQPRVWKSVDEWRSSLLEELPAKRRRSNEFVPTHEPAAVPVVVPVAPPAQVEFAPFHSTAVFPTTPEFPSQEMKNAMVEQVKAKMASELKSAMNIFLDEWIKKFKIE